MKDGSQHEPAIMDPVGIMQLIAGTSAILAGPPQEPSAPEPLAGQEVIPGMEPPDAGNVAEQTLPSGLILP
jgi:hypothetical protein